MRLNYQPHIDGLRCVAVISVLMFHLGIPFFSGGFVGVDIFFVISGFLITQLIVNEFKVTNTFDFKNFYIRRFRRLFPALIFTLITTFIAAFLFFSINYFQRFNLSLLSTLFSVSNFYFWKNNDYFSPGSEFEPLLHTWSLSIEEQFYFLWPLALVFLLKRTQMFAMIFVALLLASLSLCLNFVFSDNQQLIFYLLPFRVFEFGIGALLVWLIKYQPNNDKWLEAIMLLGFSFVIYTVSAYTNKIAFPTYNALLPCIGAAMIIYAGNAKKLSDVLTNKLFVSIGLISYSLYLVHWPIIVFYKYYNNLESLTYLEKAVIAGVSFFVAVLMYYFIEQPFRKKRSSVELRLFFIVSLVIFLSLGAIASIFYFTKAPRWQSNDALHFKNTNYAGEQYAWETHLGSPSASRHMIFYGDSHSKQYLSALESFALTNNIAIDYLGHPACLSLPNLTNIYHDTTHQSCIDMLKKLTVATANNNTPVMLAYRYTKTLIDSNTKQQVSYKNESEYIPMMLKGLDELRSTLGDDRKIIIIGNVPATNSKKGYLDCITRPISTLTCYEQFPVNKGEFISLRNALLEYQKQHRNILFIDPYLALCNQYNCYVAENEQLYYSDHAHLTKDGANKVFATFSDEILNFINTSQLTNH